MDNRPPKMSDNNKWIHDFLDEQSSEEYLFHPVSDEEILDKENELVDRAGLNSKYADEVNTFADWQLFKKRLNTGRIISLRPLLKYAAIIALPLMISSAVYFLNKDKSVEKNNQVVRNAPTQKKVILILQDGSSVDLQAGKNVKGLNGLQINKQKGTLDYTNAESSVSIDKPVFNTLVVPKGSDYKLVLEDGTEVWINADTKIKYQVNLAKSITREVYLEGGEAYFKVTKNPDKPFIVHHGDMSIRVLGTSFNVNAYSGIIYTTLVEGKVKVGVKNSSGVQLTPGQQAKFDTSTGVLEKQDVDVFPFVAWKDGILSFDNTSLESFMEQVGRMYDYDIEFNDSQLKQLHFNGRMEKTATVRELLDIIQKTTNVKFNLKDRRIMIEKTTK